MLSVRQLITRISDELHQKLKRKAAAEGRSMNALVTDALEDAVTETERERYFRQLEEEGRRYIPPQPENPPGLDAVIEATRGMGTAVSEALDEGRGPR